MPLLSIVILSGIVFAFVAFMAALSWGCAQTSSRGRQNAQKQ